MSKKLSKLLEKRGIKSEEDLSPEERETFERYKRVLTGDTVTLESIKDFCKAQIRVIENNFAGAETKNDIYYKACLHVYLNLLKAIEAPEAERESLEQHIAQLIK